MTEVAWIFFLLILYWGYSVFWGIRGATRARTAEDFFIAGRQLPLWVFVLAATATTYSGWSFVGDPGQVYLEGLQYGYGEMLAAIAMPLAGVLFLKRQWLLGQHFGFITPGEMFSYYFQSKGIRLLVVLVAVSFSVPYVGLQLRAAGFLFNILTDGLIDIEFGMWVLGLMVVSYVASGGLRTVAYVSSAHMLMIAIGIIAIGSIVLVFVGGWDRLLAGIAVLTQNDAVRTPDGYSHYVAIPGVIQIVSDGTQAHGGAWTATQTLTFSFGAMGIMASPAFSMWAFSSRTAAAFAPQQVWASAFVMGIISIAFTTVQGFGGHFLGADQSFMLDDPGGIVNPVLVEGLRWTDLTDQPGGPDALVPHLIALMSDIAPWLVALLALCALAAMESTAACYMATASGILTRDLFKPFLMPRAADVTQKFVGRVCTVLVVVLALAVATTASDALVLIGGLAVSYGFQMWPALIAACYWPFLTRQGVALGLMAGLVAVTLTEPIAHRWLGITAWGRWPLTIHSAAWGILANFGIAIVVSYFTRDNAKRKREFHDFLAQYAGLPTSKRHLIPVAWAAAIGWIFFALGPGAVLGNTLFGDPNDPQSWWFGIPSLWLWQFLAWLSGVVMIWFLAYHMEMSTAPRYFPRTEVARFRTLPRIRLKRTRGKMNGRR